jgi:hypothetical protein
MIFRVIHDIYYDRNGYDEFRNRVIIEKEGDREYLVPLSDYLPSTRIAL